MMEYADYDECALILKQELRMLEQIQVLQGQVKNAVRSRQWTDFEGHLGSLAAIGDEFEALDRDRVQIFTAFARRMGFNYEVECPPQGPDFYAFAARLPEKERRELSELYRCIKMRTLGVRFANDSLMNYLDETQAVVSGFLEAVFPDRKGKIYSRRGTQVNPDMRSMVLNQTL
ncbi:hypothetical protein FACS1894137_10750 [Spirochaetia bacterium]|nr:hypothetical protein FACS1894137_10750 [Spirochaetia bacterium]